MYNEACRSTYMKAMHIPLVLKYYETSKIRNNRLKRGRFRQCYFCLSMAFICISEEHTNWVTSHTASNFRTRVGKNLEIHSTVAKQITVSEASEIHAHRCCRQIDLKIVKHPLLRATQNYRRKIFYFPLHFPHFERSMTLMIYKIHAPNIGYLMRFTFFKYCTGQGWKSSNHDKTHDASRLLFILQS